MTKAGKKESRRPPFFWRAFNEWWRVVLEESGRRPEASAINRWYEENAHEVWSSDDMPTMLETRVHAKCLRSVDEVRNYFRAYRAQRRADAATRVDSACGGDALSDDTDGDVPFPRAAGRRPVAALGNKTHSAAAAATQPSRGGVSKVMACSTRQWRSASPGDQPHAHAQAGPFPQSHGYQDRVGMDTGTGGPEDGGCHSKGWWPVGQQAQPSGHRQAFGGAVAGSSVVITGFPQAGMRFHALNHAKPSSPAGAGHGAVAARRDCLNPPGFGAGMAGAEVSAYGALDRKAPCSSVSTASLDALLGLPQHDDPRDDDAAFCTQRQQQHPEPQQPQQQSEPPNQMSAGYPQQQQQCGLGGGAAVLQQQPHAHDRPPDFQHHHQQLPPPQQHHHQYQQQHLYQQHPQQQQMLLAQQQQSQQRPGLDPAVAPLAATAVRPGLHNVFDDSPGGGMDSMVHVELTLLPRHAPKHQEQQQHLQPQHQPLYHPQHCQVPGASPPQDGACLEASMPPGLVSPPPPLDVQADPQRPDLSQPSPQQHAGQGQQQCQQRPIEPYVCGWGMQDAMTGCHHQHQQHHHQQRPTVGSSDLASVGVSHALTQPRTAAPLWRSSTSQHSSAVTTPATPMDGVTIASEQHQQEQQQAAAAAAAAGAAFAWPPSAGSDGLQMSSSPADGCASLNGLDSLPGDRQQHHQQQPREPFQSTGPCVSAGMSPDAPSSLSNITPAAPHPLEAIEPPQPPLAACAWPGEHAGSHAPFAGRVAASAAIDSTGAAATTVHPVGGIGPGVTHGGPPQPQHQSTPTWLGTGLPADASAAARDPQQRLLQQLHGSAGSGAAPAQCGSGLGHEPAAAAAYSGRQLQQHLMAAGRMGPASQSRSEPQQQLQLSTGPTASPSLPPFAPGPACDRQQQHQNQQQQQRLSPGSNGSSSVGFSGAGRGLVSPDGPSRVHSSPWGEQCPSLPLQPVKSHSFTVSGGHAAQVTQQQQQYQQLLLLQQRQQQLQQQLQLQLQQQQQLLQHQQQQLQLHPQRAQHIQQLQQLQTQEQMQQPQQRQLQHSLQQHRQLQQAAPPLPPGFLSGPALARASAGGAVAQPADSHPGPARALSWSHNGLGGGSAAMPFAARAFEGGISLAQHSATMRALAVSASAAAGSTLGSASVSSAPVTTLLGPASAAAAQPAPSPGACRRHSQSGGSATETYTAMPAQQQQLAASCPVADLLQRWQRGDPAEDQQTGEGPSGFQGSRLLQAPQTHAQPAPVAGQAPVQSVPTAGPPGEVATNNPYVKQEAAGAGASTASVAAPFGVAPMVPGITPLVAPSGGAAAAAVQPRAPILVRTLSAPAGDGSTPRSAAAAAAAVAAASTAAVASVLPCGGRMLSCQMGQTPSPRVRHQHLQQQQQGQQQQQQTQQGQQQQGQGPPAQGAGPGNCTPGSAAGFGSPGACWGDRALAELEGDSAWLSNLLSTDLSAPALPYF